MKSYLILEDGEVFEGERLFGEGDVVGELVFNTDANGYMETLSDPASFGQIIVQTSPMIGNYGAIKSDLESEKVWAAGLIVRELCQNGSNFRKDCELSDFLIQSGTAVLSGLDTRAITKKIRESGSMGAVITNTLDAFGVKTKTAKAFRVKNAVQQTSVKQIITMGSGKKVVILDLGCKKGVVDCLVARGCMVTKVPFDTTADQILQLSPQAILLSGGGGNPEDYPQIVEEIKKLVAAKIPMMGIGLGHQLLAMAFDANIKKLPCGHRGGQPVREVSSDKILTTAQNHSYAVITASLDKTKMAVSFTNMGDKSCEGIDYTNLPVFGVQFCPEGCPGSKEAEYLFDRLLSFIHQGENHA